MHINSDVEIYSQQRHGTYKVVAGRWASHNDYNAFSGAVFIVVAAYCSVLMKLTVNSAGRLAPINTHPTS